MIKYTEYIFFLLCLHLVDPATIITSYSVLGTLISCEKMEKVYIFSSLMLMLM